MDAKRQVLALRERCQLSREQLAAALGVSGRTIARWENGLGEPSQLARRVIRLFLDEFNKSAGDNHADR